MDKTRPRWTKGEQALAHIQLAHAGVAPSGEEWALRLFVADELLGAGVISSLVW